MSLQTALTTDCLNKPICRADPESPVIHRYVPSGPARIQPFWGSGPEELRAATLFLAITERRRISHSNSTSLGPKNCSGYDYTQIWWVIPTIVQLQIRGHSSHRVTLRSIWRSSSSPARPSERRGPWDWPRTGSCTEPSFSKHISKPAMLLLVEHKVAKAAQSA